MIPLSSDVRKNTKCKGAKRQFRAFAFSSGVSAGGTGVVSEGAHT
jgi:hypothetical protein